VTIVIGSALYRFLWSLIRVAVYIGVGFLLGASFPAIDIPAVLLTLALSVVAFGAVGVLGASIILVLKAWDPVTALFSGLSWLLGGVLYPVASLPAIAQIAAWVLPITHALEAMRGALLRGAGISELAGPLSVLAGFALIVLPLSLFTFRWALRHLRVEGSMAHY
jgi:ABC-2 type transport system permease protein